MTEWEIIEGMCGDLLVQIPLRLYNRLVVIAGLYTKEHSEWEKKMEKELDPRFVLKKGEQLDKRVIPQENE